MTDSHTQTYFKEEILEQALEIKNKFRFSYINYRIDIEISNKTTSG